MPCLTSSPLPVALLVGGFGTRLRSVVSDVPKPLAPVGGEPFLFLLFRRLSYYGVKDVVLLTGYLHDQIVAACGDGSQFELDIQYSCEPSPLGTAGALKHAESHLRHVKEFILMNGDTYLNAPLDRFFEKSLALNTIGRIGVLQQDEQQRYGSIDMDTSGHIIGFREKDSQSAAWINAGIYRLTPDIFSFIPKNEVSSLERTIFPIIIEKQYRLEGFPLKGTLHDIGTPESYSLFSQERSRL